MCFQIYTYDTCNNTTWMKWQDLTKHELFERINYISDAQFAIKRYNEKIRFKIPYRVIVHLSIIILYN